MMTKLLFPLTLVAALGSGLMSGVFFAFSSFIMGALGRLPAAQGVATFQSINVVVINPLFLGVFLGTGLVAGALALHALWHLGDPGALWRVAGAVLYIIGVIVVTRAANVPRNDALAALSATSSEAASYWARFLVEWTMWNSVRTIAGLLAAAAFTLALVRR